MSDLVRQFKEGGRVSSWSWKDLPLRDLLIVTSVYLTFFYLLFCLGGVQHWTHVSALGFSAVTLCLLIGQKTILGERALVALVKSPIFWVGFIFFVIIWIQSWNIHWTYVITNKGQVQMVYTEHIKWLPRGITAPLLYSSSPYRTFIFILPAWIGVCAIWAGVKSQRTLVLFFYALAVTGFLYGAYALQQHYVDSKMILGIWEPPATKVRAPIPFWGILINENHSANLLILLNGIALGLFSHSLIQSIKNHQKKGSFAFLFFAFSLVISFSILMTQARGSIVLLILQWIGVIGIFCVFCMQRYKAKGILFPLFFLLIFSILTSLVLVNSTVYEGLKKSWELTLSTQKNPELEARTVMLSLTTDLIVESPWLGHGAGSFRYLHLPKLKDYPEFKLGRKWWQETDPKTGKRKWKSTTVWFNRAHVDLHEWVVEFGFIGMLFPMGVILWMLFRSLRAIRYWDYGLTIILMSVGIIFLGAFFEFHLRGGAMFFLTWVVLAAVLKIPILKKEKRENSRSSRQVH